MVRNSLVSSTFHNQLQPEKLKTLAVIFIFTSFLSLVGSASIIAFILKRKVATKRTVLPLFHLFMADLLSSLGVIIGAISNVAMVNYNPQSPFKEYRSYCIVVTMFTTTFFMATFLLTVNFALQSYILVSERLEDTQGTVFGRLLSSCNWGNYFPIFSWICPMILAIVIMFIDPYKKGGLNDDICTWCFPLFFYENSAKCAARKDYEENITSYFVYKAIFLFMIGFTLVIVSILFYLSLSRFRKFLRIGGVIGHEQYYRATRLRNRTLLLIGTLFFCWIMPLILGLMSLSNTFKMKTYFSLYVIEAITSPLQGFLNTLVYGWFSVQFRGETRPDIQRPLLEPCTPSPLHDVTSEENINSHQIY